MATEHERIEKNTQAINMINRRLDHIQQLLGSEVKAQPALVARPTYSFVFGAAPIELGGAVAAKATGEWIPFNRCRRFYQNKTDQPQTVTITIKNTSGGTMQVHIRDESGHDEDVTDIDDGETVTIIVVIPAGQSLHADQDGEYLR